MKKRLASIVLTAAMLAQMLTVSSFAYSHDTWEEPKDPTNFSGMTIRFVKPENLANGSSAAGKNVFAIELYTVNQPMAGMDFVADYTENVTLANKNTGKAVTTDNNTMWASSGKVMPTDELVDYYNDNVANVVLVKGEEIDILQDGVGIFEFGNTNTLATRNVTCGLTRQTGLDSGLKALWESAGEGMYDPADGGGKVHLATMWMTIEAEAIANGITIDNITADQIFSSLTSVNLTNAQMETINIVDGKSVAHLENFNAPAKAPTNVTITAAPSSVTSGEDVTLTVSGTSPDGGTLSYAYATGETAPDATAMAALTFQSGKTFTIPAVSSDTKYWGVVKNTKNEGGESTAYACSATSASVSVQQKIDSVTLAVVEPIAGEAPGAFTVDSSAGYTLKSTTWDPTLSGGKFAASKVYTATVVLAAKSGNLFISAAKTGVTLTGTAAKASTGALINGNSELQFDIVFPATGKTGAQLVADAKTAISGQVGANFPVDQRVTNPGTAGAADNTTAADIKNAIEAKIAGLGLTGVTATVSTPSITLAAVPGKPSADQGVDGSYTATITITAGSASDTFSISGGVIKAQVASKYHQNKAAVDESKQVTDTYTFAAISMTDKNTQSALQTYVKGVLDGMGVAGATCSLSDETFTPAVGGTYTNQAGTAGSYRFTATYSKGTVAGTWTGVGDNTVDYKVTAKTKEFTVVIQPTPFVAQITAAGTVRTVPGFESLEIAWTAPQTNDVAIKPVNYTLTVATAAGQVVSGYSDKDMGQVQKATVKGLVNGTNYVVTVKANMPVDTGLSVQIATSTGSPVAGDPKPIKLLAPKNDATGNADATVGKATLSMADGSEIPMDAASEYYLVRENFMVQLKAEPAAGHKFLRWERAAWTNPPATFGMETFSFEDTEATYTQNPLTVKASEASEYTAVFTALTGVVTTGNPKLSDLDVNVPMGRPTVQENADSATAHIFDSNVTEYTLYLTKDEDIVSLNPYFNSKLYDVSYITTIKGVVGTATPYAAIAATPGDEDTIGRTGAPIEVKGLQDGDKIVFTITEKAPGSKSTAYTVNFKTVANNPRIILELDSSKGKELAALSVKAATTDFISGTFSITCTNDAVGFAGFTNESGVLQGDGVATATDLYKNLNSAITIDRIVFTDGGKTIQVSFSSASGHPVSINNDNSILFKLMLKKNPACVESATENELLTALKINTASDNLIVDKLFGELKYVDSANNTTAAADPVAAEDRVVVLRLAQKYAVVAFVNGRVNGTRVNYDVFDCLNGVEEQINDVPIVLDQNGKLFYRTVEGTYKLIIQSPGFLSVNLNNVQIVDRDVEKDAVLLMGGDVNCDNVINASDRTLLIKALGQVVQGDTAASGDAPAVIGGYVQMDGQLVYADLNDDGVVNAADMGVLLRSLVYQTVTP